MSDYLERFFKDKKVRKDPSTKYAIQHDKWDKKVADQLTDEMKEYVLASKELTKKVDTGFEAMTDTLYSLFKAAPHLKNPDEIRPSFLINHSVISEMMGMKEYEGLRGVSKGDAIAAGLSAVAMEPELEVLFDKLDKAKQQAEQLEQQLQEYEDYSDKVDELMDAAANAQSEKEAKDYQKNAAALQEQLEALKDAIEQGQQDLGKELGEQSFQIQESLKKALGEAQEQGESLSNFDGWSLQPGVLKKMDPKARLELAKKLKTDKFKRMAEIIGRMQNIALTEQLERSKYAVEEIYDLEQGADLSRLLPTEFVNLGDDVLVYKWMNDFVERKLIQYKLRGQENVNKGGIILLEDGSSSMGGEREIWAKAIGLALLKIATMQKRSFYGVHFAGPGQYVTFDFDNSSDLFSVIQKHHSDEQRFEGANAIMAYAEMALMGGTDFMTPLSVALDRLNKEFSETGAVEADIVFLTDGQCGVPDNFLKEFKATQETLGFSVYGIAIGTSPNNEPLFSICDEKVIGLRQLTDVNDLRPLFGAL